MPKPKPNVTPTKRAPRRRNALLPSAPDFMDREEAQQTKPEPTANTTPERKRINMDNKLRNTIIATLFLLAFIVSSSRLFEASNASEVLVITHLNGTIVVHSEAGAHFQGFGDAVHYPRRGTFAFEVPKDKTKFNTQYDTSLDIRFNDSGTAKLGGVLNYEMSANAEQVKELHSQYQSPEAVQQQLIKSFLQMDIFNTGSLLSSTESYSSSRGLMMEYIQRQLTEGIFATDGTLTKEKDSLGFERTMTKIQIRKDKNGVTEVSNKSPFSKFGIIVQSLNINSIDYDDKVDMQIQAQLDAIIKVQTAIAEAKKAEQDKITAEQKGLADKAVAEAEANVLLAKATIEAEQKKVVAVTEATQKKEVATLALETAKLDAESVIEKGKADAEARKLVMEADGALEIKTKAYVQTQEAWAKAFSEIKQPLVPTIVTGGSSSQGGNAISNMMDMLSTKAALDLSLNLKPAK